MSQSSMRDFLNKTYEAMEVEAGSKKREFTETAEETGGMDDNSKASKKSKTSSGSARGSSNSPPPKTPMKDMEVIDSESSDEDEEQDEWQKVKVLSKFSFPAKNELNIVLQAALKTRFSMVIKYPLPSSPDKQLVSTMSKLNTLLDLIAEVSPKSGKIAIVPWEDDEIYSDRIITKFAKTKFHDEKGTFQTNLAKEFMRHCIHKWSQLPAKVLNQTEGEPATKWFNIQLAYVSNRAYLPEITLKEWSAMVSDAAARIDGFSLEEALTQVKDPIPAVQFLNSVINPGGDWAEEGHLKALPDLSRMIGKLLGPEVEFGLSARRFDCGSYGRQLPRVIALTVDKSKVAKVQQELATIFSKDNKKKDQIQAGVTTSWIAIPTFSSVTSSRDETKISSYAALLAQEKSFQKTIRTTRVNGIRVENLDRVAEERFHLNGYVLHQLERELLDNGFASMRRVIYDRIFKETKQRLVTEKILEEAPDIEQDQLSMEKRISETSDSIPFQAVLEAMEQEGVISPYGTNPVPRPSRLTLRQMLLSLKSRSFPGENVLVFDSVVISSDGSVLLSFKAQLAEEAQSIADLLPAFIRHEMHVDPNFFCHSSLIQDTLDGVYNPISRKGFQARFKNAMTTDASPSKRHCLPEFCRNFPVAQLVQVLKTPAFAKSFPVANDDELASLAQSILTSPPFESTWHSMPMENLESTIVRTKDMEEDLSGLSGVSFDSKTSRNAHHIEERATFKMRDDSMRLLAQVVRENRMSSARDIMSLGKFTLEDFRQSYPKETEVLENYLSFSDSDSDDALGNSIPKTGTRNQAKSVVELMELDLEDEDGEEDRSEDQDRNVKVKGSQEASSDSESVSSEDTEVAGSPSKGTGGPNPGGSN